MQILGLIFAQMCIFTTQNTIKSLALYEYSCEGNKRGGLLPFSQNFQGQIEQKWVKYLKIQSSGKQWWIWANKLANHW